MTSLLEGKLKRDIARVFKGKLTLGTLRRETSGGLDSYGDSTGPTVTTFAFEGIRESFTAFYKAQSGIPDTDVKILVLLGSCKPPIMPKQDDKVYLKAPWNKWHHVRKQLGLDPAGASVELQCYEIPTP